MAFILPTFNLTCGIWTYGTPLSGPARLEVECQLRAPTMSQVSSGAGTSPFTYAITLLLPPGTDIRDHYSGAGSASDWVEVPLGSECWYQVLWVNDVGKGFPNEHRYASIAKTTIAGGWPIPIP